MKKTQTEARKTFTATFPNGRVEQRESTRNELYAVARHDGTGRVTFHETYESARRAQSRTSMLVRVDRAR